MVLILLIACAPPPRDPEDRTFSLVATGVDLAEAQAALFVIREPAGATFPPEADGRGSVIGAWVGAADVNLLAGPEVGVVEGYPGLTASVTLGFGGDLPLRLGVGDLTLVAEVPFEVTLPWAGPYGDVRVALDAGALWASLGAWTEPPDLAAAAADPAWWVVSGATD